MSRRLVAVALMAMFLPLVYTGIGKNDFALDADLVVDKNPIVREHRIADAFHSSWWGPSGQQSADSIETLYRPLTLVYFIVVDWIGSEDSTSAGAAIYNRANVGLHTLLAILRFLFLMTLLASWRWRFPVALGASLFAAWHGMAAESVVGMVGAAEMLAQIFIIGSWWTFTLGLREKEAVRAWSFLVTAAVCWFGALLSKENAAMFPAVLFAQALILGRTGQGDAESGEGQSVSSEPFAKRLAFALASMLPLIVVLIAWVVIRTQVLGAFAAVAEQSAFREFAPFERVTSSLAAFFSIYAQAFVWPFDLNPNISHQDHTPPVGLMDARVLGGLLLWLLLVGGTLWQLWRRRIEGVALLFAVLAFLPTSNLLLPIGAIAAYRFAYGSLFGLGLFIAMSATRHLGSGEGRRVWRGKILTGFLVLSILVGLVATRQLVKAWRSLASLTTYTMEFDENSVWALHNNMVVGSLAGPLDIKSSKPDEDFARFDAMEKNFVRVPSTQQIDFTTRAQCFNLLSNRVSWEAVRAESQPDVDGRLAGVILARRSLDRVRRYAKGRPINQLNVALQDAELTFSEVAMQASPDGGITQFVRQKGAEDAQSALEEVKLVLLKLGDRVPLASRLKYLRAKIRLAQLQGDDNAVKLHAARALELSPGDADALSVAVKEAIAAGQKGRALKIIESGIAAGVPTVGLLWEAAQLSRGLGQFDKSLRFLNRLVRTNARSPQEATIIKTAADILRTQAQGR
ncbi:MAG: hypothetical protein V3W41_20615 [Planctomycetota bacterium]